MKKETKETRKQKIVSEIIAYVKKYGTKKDDIIYWSTDPVCIKDVCVNNVALAKTGDTENVLFGDFRNKKFISFRNAENLEYNYLQDVLNDMKSADKAKNK